MLLRWVVVAALLCGCGRIGYDELDRRADAAIDAAAGDGDAIDASRLCPAGTTELSAGSNVCVEQAERGYGSWTDASATCAGAGRRLCTDAEWAEACAQATGLVDMANDQGGAAPEWEWVAEMSAGSAWKRGYDTCDATSIHPVTDAYDYRCCYDKP